MTSPFGTRVIELLVCGKRELAAALGVSTFTLNDKIGLAQGNLAEADSDPFWRDMDLYLATKIAQLEGLRREIADKAEKERKRRLKRRLETMR